MIKKGMLIKMIIKLENIKNYKGKAGNLGILYHKYNIAKGFIIPDYEFRKFLNYNNININDNLELLKSKILNGEFVLEKNF